MTGSASVHDVAAYILEQTGTLATMKFQKLLYYCNGWYSAVSDEPLFESRIEAWKYGPVVRDVYTKHRRQTAVTTWEGNPSQLSQAQRSVIDIVLNAYGAFSGMKLADMTHNERPWAEAWARKPIQGFSTEEISPESIRDYFRELRSNAREESGPTTSSRRGRSGNSQVVREAASTAG
ncbi:Panacea domain-containing protein [Nesterenkonia haasae]|uniref:Panacea domain-containing protein n=1 Tax=Nesterenkonia haasae TaxID=2587813 RepID=UPI0013918F5A|nr:DUF4065 domain-containing protein [Nesterenkonia haasae]